MATSGRLSAPLSPSQSLLPRISFKTTDAAARRDKKLNHGSLELALLFVRFNHIARVIVNANHSIIALEIEPAEH
jgi:hypothetical protein